MVTYLMMILQRRMKGKTRRTDVYPKHMFHYDKTKDCFICPEGECLTYRYEYYEKSKDRMRRVYLCGAAVCRRCPSMEMCTKSKRGRTVKSYGHEALMMRMADKVRSEAGRERYKLRARTVEAPIGDIKQNQGLREFLTRGVESVKAEFNLACTAHNLKRIWNYMRDEGVLNGGLGTRVGAAFNLGGFNFESIFVISTL